jgi:hypothetical protein
VLLALGTDDRLSDQTEYECYSTRFRKYRRETSAIRPATGWIVNAAGPDACCLRAIESNLVKYPVAGHGHPMGYRRPTVIAGRHADISAIGRVPRELLLEAPELHSPVP